MCSHEARGRTGFTLVELLVVIAIIMALVGILMPALSSARAKGRQVVCQSQLRQLAVAFAAYNGDRDGGLPYSWNLGDDSLWTNAPAGYFQNANFWINGTGWPPSATSGFPYNTHTFAWNYYPYLNNADVFTCPTQLGIQLQRHSAPTVQQYNAMYVDLGNVSALVYSHYRQNPFFGHNGMGPGRPLEVGAPANFNAGPGVSANSSAYAIQGARVSNIRRPDSTVLNFDCNPYRFNFSYGTTPTTANAYYVGGGADRTLASSYSPTSDSPIMGFIHGISAAPVGNFSFVDGHVSTLSTNILTDFNDTFFRFYKL